MNLDDLPPVRAFGTWDAPVTDDAEWIDVPLDLSCMYCRQRFMLWDSGAVMPNGFAQHRECSLRSVLGGIGHLVDHDVYCKGELGPDAGLSYRESAMLVWMLRHGTPITVEQLEAMRLAG